MTKFIAVASGKGGVGKTTASINIAAALASFGRNSAVFDACLHTPNIGIHLGSSHSPATVHDAVLGKKSIREAIYMHPSGIKIIPGSSSINDCSSADPKKLPEVMAGINGLVDFVVVDCASGIREDAVSALKHADEVIAITTNDLPSVMDTSKTVKLAESLGKPVVGVLVSMSRPDSYGMDEKSIESMLDSPVIGIIPEDSSVRESLKIQHPVVYSHPDSSAAIAFRQVAASLLGEKYNIIKPRKSGLNSFFSFLGLK